MAKIEISKAKSTDLPANEKAIIGKPIYERLIGKYDSINQKFDGKFTAVINDLKNTFGGRASV